MINFIRRLDWFIVLILAFGLGLAPFSPPHLYGKLLLLIQGNLLLPMDWFDLFLHGLPWCILITKVIISLKGRGTAIPR